MCRLFWAGAVAEMWDKPERRAAPDEFFLLLWQVGCRTNKTAMRFGKIRRRLSARADDLDSGVDSLRAWAAGSLFTLLAGFGGVIFSLRR
jgi:hypothetical protein